MNHVLDDQFSVLEKLLAAHGQQHVLRFWDRLTAQQQSQLHQQIESIDWDQLSRLIGTSEDQQSFAELAARAESPPAVTWEQYCEPQHYRRVFERGAEAIRRGQVGFILTAGGQGSRLGFEHPKGLYPIGPLSQRSLFQIMIEHCAARGRQFDAEIPIFIMTSPQTDRETREFLETQDWFGYPREHCRIFCQGSMPAIDAHSGRVLLNGEGEIATNPDGHGGMLQALGQSGILADLQSRGCETLFYGQIDNPLLQVCHPALLGVHLEHQSEMTTQVVRKNEPSQKVGNVVKVDGRLMIIEYSDLPAEAAAQRGPDGQLKFWAGSIAVHVFDRRFLARALLQGTGLPFHRAHKKVPHLSATGDWITPADNNAIKFERFIFDLLPWAERALVCEVDPRQGFAALKNAPPAASETPEWVRRAVCDLHREWILQAGGAVAPGVDVEISPFFAVDAEQLQSRPGPPLSIQHSTYLRE